ncbi:MAG TPA: hypothetical protein VMW28_04420 [Pelolinea sp.]|nr:hypothetical protein [Pelolinea sp.]
MEFLGNLSLVFMVLLGYSSGRVFLNKKYKIPAELYDFGLVVPLWSSAFIFNFEKKWVSYIVWIGIAFLLGMLVTIIMRSRFTAANEISSLEETQQKGFRKLWSTWKSFIFRMGNFQSRLILLLFYFSVVAPFAMINRIFRDPLNLKKPNVDTFWFPLKASQSKIDDARRQF